MKELEKTSSICPECYLEGNIKKIDATIVEDDGKVYITKTCDKHGFFKDIYFGDVNLYKKWMKYRVMGGSAPDVKTKVFDEPALYDEHKSQSALTNLLITNRSDIKSSNSCFLNADEAGYVYEPNLNQIKGMLIQARKMRPIGSKSLQIAGGEPTLRDDLLDIISLAKGVGFSHVQINTNGLKLAENIEYCKQLKNAQVNTVYMSFDGVTKRTNPWINSHKKAIRNLKKADLKTVLVPVLIGDKNLHEAGKIVKFALSNMDIIKGVYFQPVSFCGRKINDGEREKQRVDYVKMMEVIEKEFNGEISRDDFYPVPFVFPVSRLIELLKGETQVEFSSHPGCGGATYIFVDDGKPIPITRFIDVEGLLEFVDKESKIKGPLKKLRIASAFLTKIDNFADYKKAPQGFNLKKILKDAASGGSYDSLRAFYYNILFVGSMWFQDAFNLNVDRLERCVIHYTTPEGIVPFCTYNCLGIGEKIMEKYSLSIKEWERKTGKKIKDDLINNVAPV